MQSSLSEIIAYLVACICGPVAAGDRFEGAGE